MADTNCGASRKTINSKAADKLVVVATPSLGGFDASISCCLRFLPGRLVRCFQVGDIGIEWTRRSFMISTFMIDESDNCFSSRLDLDLLDPNDLGGAAFNSMLDGVMKGKLELCSRRCHGDHVPLAHVNAFA
jgi:hypothetical protein